ncbi:MAG: hypothetical protein QXM92_02525 [Candidatus Anstonellales archaeon]
MNMNTTNNNPSYIIRIKVMQGSYKNMPTIYTIDISERIDASTGPTVAATNATTATNKQEVRRYYTSSFGADYKFKLISKVLGNKLHMHSKEPNNAYNYFHFTEFIAEDIDSDTVDIILFIVQHGHLIKDQVDADTSSIEEICDLIKVYKTLVI